MSYIRLKTLEEFIETAQSVGDIKEYVRFLNTKLEVGMLANIKSEPNTSDYEKTNENIIFIGFEISESLHGNKYLYCCGDEQHVATIRNNSIDWCDTDKINTIEDLTEYMDLLINENCLEKYPITKML